MMVTLQRKGDISYPLCLASAGHFLLTLTVKNVIIFQNVDETYISVFQNVDETYILVFQNVDMGVN